MNCLSVGVAAVVVGEASSSAGFATIAGWGLEFGLGVGTMTVVTSSGLILSDALKKYHALPITAKLSSNKVIISG